VVVDRTRHQGEGLVALVQARVHEGEGQGGNVASLGLQPGQLLERPITAPGAGPCVPEKGDRVGQWGLIGEATSSL
jgi:hypothetical protein